MQETLVRNYQEQMKKSILGDKTAKSTLKAQTEKLDTIVQAFAARLGKTEESVRKEYLGK